MTNEEINELTDELFDQAQGVRYEVEVYNRMAEKILRQLEREYDSARPAWKETDAGFEMLRLIADLRIRADVSNLPDLNINLIEE